MKKISKRKCIERQLERTENWKDMVENPNSDKNVGISLSLIFGTAISCYELWNFFPSRLYSSVENTSIGLPKNIYKIALLDRHNLPRFKCWFCHISSSYVMKIRRDSSQNCLQLSCLHLPPTIKVNIIGELHDRKIIRQHFFSVSFFHSLIRTNSLRQLWEHELLKLMNHKRETQELFLHL